MSRNADTFTGATGTTRKETVPIATDGGDVFRAEVYTSVNADSDPELADALAEGRLNEVDGPDGRTYEPAIGVRYHCPSERTFALVVPEPLRHRTFELRQQLLQELAAEEATVPAYVSEFAVVLDPERLVADGESDAETDRQSPVSETDVAEAERADLEAERKELEEMRRDLERREEEVERERRELREERQSLEAERLNLEQKSRQLQREDSEAEEEPSTQVVTEDQFISEEPRGDAVSSDDSAPHRREEGGAGRRAEPIEIDAIPESFDDDRAGAADGYVELAGARIRASASVAAELFDMFEEQPPRVYVQLHELEGVSLPALTIAVLEDEEPVASFGWPINPDDDDHSSVLHRLSEEFALDIALYDADGDRRLGFEFRGQYEQNLEWIRERLPGEGETDEEDFERAAQAFREDDFQRVGTMRHNFDRNVFEDLERPSQVKLAAGVVGYWSEEDQFRYLVANRTYPLDVFRGLQDDVIEAALEFGIHLPEPLRDRAVDCGLVADDVDLVERQLANFAEVAVQLRDNDLDPVDEWENWDELIEFAKSAGVTPDPDVLELAESSLSRARDYRETRGGGEAGGRREAARADEGAAPETNEDSFDGEVVGRESEATGVTYFVPDEAVLDTFDDLAELPREDLEQLLDDPNGRLEAAQMLVEQYGAEALTDVLEAVEAMSAPEVTALARFMATKSEDLEDELVDAVDAAGPSATLVVARALAEARSAAALPKLLEAYRDPDRQFNREAVGRAIAQYGEKLLPEVSRSIEEDGSGEWATQLLTHLGARDGDLLDELDDHESDAVREAAERARSQRL